MKIYDISMNINPNIVVYKNKEDKKPQFATTKQGYVYETNLTLNLHTGTHIDAPLHMIENGNPIGDYDLNRFITKAQVLDFSHLKQNISANDLKQKQITPNTFVILKTKNSYDKDFNFEFVYLDKTGAEYLSHIPVIGVGIDALGIERNQPKHDTHKTLLSNNIAILEGLYLKDIKEGNYMLLALPLKINEAEAAPTRAVLIKLPKAE